MRKFLLASAASLGAIVAAAGGANAQPVKPVAPGTIVVHLNGYLQFEIAGYGSTFNNVTSPGTTAYALNATTGLITKSTVGAGVYKLNPITTDGDVRLYPGFDAETMNGIAYGVQVEIRTSTSDASVSANRVTGTGGGTGLDGLYVKRAYGYLGSVSSGFVRLGQGDGAFTLLQSGVIEAFGDGAQFNSTGGVVNLLPTAATPGNFIYADTSPLYATDKLVYISPTIAGLGFAGSYEPNSNGIQEGYGDCTTAAQLNTASTATVCAAESSSPITGDIGKRRKNLVDGMLQYAMDLGDIKIKASGGILYGAPIQYTGAAVKLGTSALHFGYDDLTVYQGGAQATLAGLTVGANIKGGQVEDSYAFKPKGARDALTYIVGASYVVGPLVLGGSYYDGQTSGAYYPGETVTFDDKKIATARTLNEYGVSGGANLVVGKDLSLFLQYLYGHKQQYGNAAFTTNGHDAQVQAIGAGGTFKW